MNVLEIKNNLVKISFNTEDNLALSQFVIIDDENNSYVAQIMNLKSDGTDNFAIVKLLFTCNEDGVLKSYNGTIPSAKANVTKIQSNELLDIIPVENPLILGNLAQQDIPLKVDTGILESNLLICSDNLTNTVDLLENITKQVVEKAVIIDTQGVLELDNKIVIGKDFKLPLNFDTIDFIYENDLEDVEAINKAIIQDVFIELQKYVETLPEKFLPFDTFVDVIDAQYRETNIPELILLKNKLLKYKDLNIFAQTLKDILDLSISIEKYQRTVIDISDMPENLQKEVIRYIYTVLNGINKKLYSFVKVGNGNITKKLLKKFIEKSNVYTTVICPHDFKYIEEAKEISQNIIFFAPLTLTHDFASYNTFLSKLGNDEFVVYGAHTQQIPLIVEIADPNAPIVTYPDMDIETTEPQAEETEEVTENTTEEIPETAATEQIVSEPLDTETQPNKTVDEEVEILQPEETFDFEAFSQQDDEQVIDFSQTENNQEPEISQESDFSQELDFSQEPEESDYSQLNIVEEIQPVDNILAGDDEPVIEPLDSEISYEEPILADNGEEDIVEQVAKDVDKVFYEKLPSEEEEIEGPEIVEDVLTEDDLNLIEDLASDDAILAGDEEIIEEEAIPVEEEELPPVVPIYPADDIETLENPNTFNPGDRVSTAKYGEGVVEKMIKYGNKLLCSIEFPNIGRRLLDPAVTDITKL